MAAAEEPAGLPLVQVTAQKALQDSQSVGASLFALDGEAAREQGRTGRGDLVGRIGNLHNQQSGSTPLLSIRGMGQRLNTPGIGLYVDDVAYLDHFAFPANLLLLDIERMEVLRGPQGTLYGGNTMGGVINIVTRQPDARRRADASLSMGEHGLRRMEAAFSTPIDADRLFFSLSAAHLRRDGFTKNSLLKRDVDTLDERGLRMRLRYLPSERLEMVLGLDVARIRDGYYDEGKAAATRLEDTQPYRVAYDFEGADHKDLRGASLKLQYDADGFSLTSITGLRDNDYSYRGDMDGSEMPLATDVYQVGQRQWTQELRLASRNGKGLTWLAGLFLFDDRRKINDRFSYVPMNSDTLTDGQRRTRGAALFGHVEYWFSPAWGLQAGLRVERERLSYQAGSTTLVGGMPVATTPASPYKRSDAEPVPKISLLSRPAAHTLVYGTLAKGYRSGGFNSRVLSEADRSYEPEKNLNYELGLKMDSADRRLRLNAALFRIDVDAQQIGQSIGAGVEATRNAGKSRHQGAELDADWMLGQGWQLSSSVAYLDAKFRLYADAATAIDHAGQRVPHVPKVVGTLALQKQHRLDMGWRLTGRAELRHVGSVVYDNANAVPSRAYELLNLRMGLERGNWSAWLWVNNATDERYVKSARSNPLTGDWRMAFGAPRSLGIDLLARL